MSLDPTIGPSKADLAKVFAELQTTCRAVVSKNPVLEAVVLDERVKNFRALERLLAPGTKSSQALRDVLGEEKYEALSNQVAKASDEFQKVFAPLSKG